MRINPIYENTEANRLKPKYHATHRRPITRRELVGQGFMYGAAYCAAPSLLGMFAQRTPQAMAAAAECGAAAAAGAGGVGYISLEIAGGLKLACNNFLVGKEGNAMDTAGWTENAFRRNGLPPQTLGYNADGQNVSMEVGVPMHTQSQILAGIISKTSPECRAVMNGGTISCTTENDNGDTNQNIQFLIAKAQRGMFAQGGGSRAGKGGRHQSPEANAADAPIQVVNPDQAMALLDSGKAGEIFGENGGQKAALDATYALSQLQSNKISALDATKVIMRCAYDVSRDQSLNNNNPTILNAEADPMAVGPAGVFTAAEMGDGEKQAMATVMKLAVGGYIGAGTIEMRGYDYHGDASRITEEMDFKVGEMIGAALEYAFRSNKKMMIGITSDGSCQSRGGEDNNTGKCQMNNDNRATAMTAWLAIDPAGRPVATPNQQIGGFDVNGQAIATNPATAGEIGMCDALFLNWLALDNKQGMFAGFQPNSPLGANLDSFISVTPVA